MADTFQETAADAAWVERILASWASENAPPAPAAPIALSPRKPPPRESPPPACEGPFCIAGKENVNPAGELFRWRRRAEERRLQAVRDEAGETPRAEFVPVFTPVPKRDKTPDFEKVGDDGPGRDHRSLLARRPVGAVLTFAGGAVLVLVLATWTGGLLRMSPAAKGLEAGARKEAVQAANAPKAAPRMVPDMKALVERFFAAPSVEERAAMVRGGKALLPAMRDYYALNPIAPAKVKIDARVEFLNDADLEFVRVTGRDRQGDPFEAFVEKTPLGPKLDWRQLTGHGDMDWNAWIHTQPAAPVTLCVIAKRDDYYGGAFADASQWICLKMTDVRKSATVWAYASRKDAVGTLLAREFRDRNRVLKLKGTFAFPPRSGSGAATGFLTPQVAMRTLQSLDWIDRSPEVLDKNRLLSQTP